MKGTRQMPRTFMKLNLQLLAVFAAALALFAGLAVPNVMAADLTEQQTQSKFENLLPLKVNKVSDSPLSGFYQLESDRGIFYASKDGKFIFSGSLHNFEEGLLNLTALRQRELANQQLAAFADQLIVYPAKQEKYRVTVFTDPTCGYCRKLHSEIAEYNKLGITIAYAAFPRGGVNSEMDKILKDVWCSTNPAEALTKAKNDMALPHRACKNPVDQMYRVGESLGINGTPALIMPNGEMAPGYVPPHQLFQTLENAG
ncbi:thioredoxin fold domain-containing protein [Shewanella algae]